MKAENIGGFGNRIKVVESSKRALRAGVATGDLIVNVNLDQSSYNKALYEQYITMMRRRSKGEFPWREVFEQEMNRLANIAVEGKRNRNYYNDYSPQVCQTRELEKKSGEATRARLLQLKARSQQPKIESLANERLVYFQEQFGRRS